MGFAVLSQGPLAKFYELVAPLRSVSAEMSTPGVHGKQARELPVPWPKRCE
jgi:hypothetical protein